MKRLLLIAAAACFLCSCAAAYKPPEAIPQPQTQDFQGKTKDAIFTAAMSTLADQGYTLTMSDRQSGIISTAKQPLKLTVADCDCGTTMGINYVKDNRTETEVAMNLTVSEGHIVVKATISGDYLPNDPVYGKKFVCVSLGTLEKSILAKIAEKLQ